MVSESLATRISPNMDIRSLRHDMMDAIYETNDQEALYRCLVFLTDFNRQKMSPLKEKLQKRLHDLSLLSDGWDGEGSKRLCSESLDFAKRIIDASDDAALSDWVFFPDSRGFLYMDYTHGADIAGITITNHQMSAFVKYNGQVKKYTFDNLDEKAVLKILEEAHGK